VLIGNADMHLKNWSLIYPDRRSAQLSPAYDLVSTIAYLPDENLALTFVDSKSFASFSSEQVARFAAKTGLPRRLIADTATLTVISFADVWRHADDGLVPASIQSVIDSHLKRVPLWREIIGTPPKGM
jgi:serine/threonine-protein kinase HipA